MQTNAIPIWRVRLATLALAALAALCGTYWVLKSQQGLSVSVPPPVAGDAANAPDPQALARALGGGQTAGGALAGAAPVRSPFVLAGVLADRAQGGAALIGVDGKPAKPYAVGAVVDGSLVLQSVHGRQAVLGEGLQGPARITLELPPLSK
jgi:general secretion pathway protein C